MRKIQIDTKCTRMLADVFTPVGIYLRLRDRYRDTILLESADHHSAENSFSFICINAIAGIEVRTNQEMEFKLPARNPEKAGIGEKTVPDLLWQFMQRFDCIKPSVKEAGFAQGLFGYTAYDAVELFESVSIRSRTEIPLIRYRLFQYVIAINHFRDELFFCENLVEGIETDSEAVFSLISNKDVPVYPFAVSGDETSPLTNSEYVEMVEKGIAHCRRGDIFQVVLSRRFEQGFTGDEFNVYRNLRSINPSPYLFFFDYGDYKIFGSSPEAALKIRNGEAILHPIAGTFKRTGDEDLDRMAADRLLKDAKENAEHVMLVDLARNDLSRLCDKVEVAYYRQVQYFSHVIHLVSEVKGQVGPGTNPFELLAKTFPAGTLSGAPKYKAMEFINEWEPHDRSFYGGAIGFVGFDGSLNHAIMIRSFLSKQNRLSYQAGAGVVVASNPTSELEEVNNKLAALKKAINAAAGKLIR